jgi:hypothetical protein
MTNSWDWRASDIGDQRGRIIVVTGANSGLGLESARALIRTGATVVMACRSTAKAEAARSSLCAETPDAQIDIMALDLASQASIHDFAAQFHAKYTRLDVLYNNAGLMGIPRGETVDGFETQFGVNHLGHFALTGLLLDMMPDSPASRVVTLSSTASWMGRVQFDDLNSTKKYTRYAAYGQSKLANLLFARELQRRLSAAGLSIRSIAAHPGFVLTELQPRAARESSAKIEGTFYNTLAPLLAHSVEEGVLPQLYAGQSPEAMGGSFYGPARRHMVGGAKAVGGPRAGRDMAVARRLWEVSEKLTGVVYPYGLGEK